MIRKLTIKKWLGVAFVLLLCLMFAVIPLWYYGPSALEALRGSVPELAEKQSMSNIYGMSALGAFFAVIALIILVRQLANPIGKRVKRYLDSHPDVTQEQLNSDFAAAKKIGNTWIGRQWTFSYNLDCILLENEGIVWVYGETEQVKSKVNYYFCFGLANGGIERMRIRKSEFSRLKEEYGKNPKILTENTPEYAYMFKHNLASFLNLKYNEGMQDK